MHSLQRMIDVGRVDAKSPIDLASITNTRLIRVNTENQEHGLWLTEEVSLKKKKKMKAAVWSLQYLLFESI